MTFIILDCTNISHIILSYKIYFYSFKRELLHICLANLQSVRHYAHTLEYSFLGIQFDRLSGKQEKKGKPPQKKSL